jgi:hypothetical protein
MMGGRIAIDWHRYILCDSQQHRAVSEFLLAPSRNVYKFTFVVYQDSRVFTEFNILRGEPTVSSDA